MTLLTKLAIRRIDQILADHSENKTAHTRFASMLQDTEEFTSYFLIKGDKVNGREWGVPEESIPKHIHTFKNMPFVVTSNEFITDSFYGKVWDHPNIEDAVRAGILPENTDINDLNLVKRFQNKFRVGSMQEVFKKEDVWLTMVKKDEPFKTKRFPPFCSPAVFKNNHGEPDDNITDWTGLHLAGLQERPAYGNIALYKGACSGDHDSCLAQFKAASMKKITPCELAKQNTMNRLKLAVLLSQTNIEVQRQNLQNKKCDSLSIGDRCDDISHKLDS